AIVLLLVMGTSAVAYFWYARMPAPRLPAPLPGPPAAAPQVAAAEPDRAGPGQILVRGRVTRPDGQPVPGADVALLTDEYREAGDRDFNVFIRRKLVAAGRADAGGPVTRRGRAPVGGRSRTD